jgi:hypothetical protein
MKKLSTIVSSLVLVVGAVFALVPQPATAVGPYYLLQNANSDKCFSPQMSAQPAAWTPIIQRDCGGAFWQLTPTGAFDPAGYPYYFLKLGADPNLCASVNNLSSTDGTGMMLWPCQNTDNQRFSFPKNLAGLPATTVLFGMKAKSSGKFMQVNGASINDGAAVTQYGYFDSPHFLWHLTLLPNPS